MWYLTDTARVASEQATLAALEAKQPWLTIVGVRLDDQIRLCLDAEIQVGPKVYPVRLTYPQTFPHTPISVLPRFPERWSDHQWGLGELCLEWGPDNWLPTITGADMVQSAHKLLRDETQANDGERPGIASRHVDSLGQQLRAAGIGFVLTQALAAELEGNAGPLLMAMRFFLRSPGLTSIIIPTSIGEVANPVWRDPTVPEALKPSSTQLNGHVAILPEAAPAPTARTAVGFKRELAEAGCAYPEGYVSDLLDMCLVWASGVARLFWVRNSVNSVAEFKCVPEGEGGRLDATRAETSARSVGLVGCGSVGAKIATSLARTGVGNFLLIDDDLMLPENLVRQDLDWDGVGDHKVEALRRRIEMVAPGTTCTVRRQQLAGQESSGNIDGVLTLLQKCDLIIDATANPRVFNLLGAVVAAAKKPLVWVEVFGGGIGGLVARSRPGIDPSPQVARARIDAWCAEKKVAAPQPAGRYEIDAPDGPMIADDADVGIIAGHATRFAIDLLVQPNESKFPVSAYFVGLTEGWLFLQPFHTFPVDLGAPEPSAERPVDPTGLETVTRLISERRDHHPAA